MVEFNVREIGNEMVKILEKELGPRTLFRVTIDVVIPENLRGDKDGLCNSIIEICRCLNAKIARLVVDIEMLRADQFSEFIAVSIDIKASNSDYSTLDPVVALGHDAIGRLLAGLPYATSYAKSDISARFNFQMTFQYSGVRKSNGNLFGEKQILLAEDSEISSLVFMAFVEELGCSVICVSNGQQAISEVRRNRFDIIFIDVHMPGLSGMATIQKIRELDRRVPIVAVVTSSMKRASLAARQAGADSVITKPVDRHELQKALVHYFGLR
jgi:CheY-like chemotaxis protein